MALHAAGTFDTFVVSDDLRWVERSAADARRPWNIFVEPLFGDYYRPMPHAMWLTNYYLWGFNFRGYQFMFILLWMAVAALVYAVGCRLGGRGVGATAGALTAFHGVYLLIASWKSWYTTTTELAAVLAWLWCLTRWQEAPSGRRLGWMIAAGAAAILSRELAPLFISTALLVVVVLPRFEEKGEVRRGAWKAAAIWAVATLLVLAALPSYRGLALGMLPADAAVAPGEGGGPSPANALRHFRSHAQSIFHAGVWGWFLWLALVWELGARLKWGTGEGRDERGRFVIGAFVLGAIVLAIPDGARVFGSGAEGKAEALVMPLIHAALILAFLAIAWGGDRWDRMLGACFLVTFLPILVLEHGSGAYHMLAYVALSLYAARALWRRAMPEMAQLAEDWRGGRREWDERAVLGLCLAVVLCGQAWVLGRNLHGVQAEVRRRAAYGREMEGRVQTTVSAFVEREAARRACVSAEPYAALAGLILERAHGFAVEPLGGRVGLRRFDLPLAVYAGATAYDEALFRRCNVFPNAGFEEATSGIPTATPGRQGGRAALALAEGDGLRSCTLDLGPFGLRKGTAVVFGGFVRAEGDEGGSVGMSFRAAVEGGYQSRTGRVAVPTTGWQLLWGCAAPPVGEGRYLFRVIEGEKLRNARVLVDDIFICPVEALMEATRESDDSGAR